MHSCYRCGVELHKDNWLDCHRIKKQNICRWCNAVYRRAIYHSDPHKQHEHSKKYLQKLKQMVFEHYGKKCVCCGEAHFPYLQLDHINNDGFIHRKNLGSQNYWLNIIKSDYPNTLQILCANCHYAKTQKLPCSHS